MSSSSFSPSPSSTASSTPTPTIGSGGGAPPTATLLFSFLVIFAALLAAFLFLAFFWKIQHRRHSAFGPETDETGGVRGVPKLWEVWIRDEPSGENQSNWESTCPLSIDVDRVPSEEATSPTSHARRPWPRSLFRRRAVPQPPSSQAQQVQSDGPDAEGATTAGLISGGLRVSFVIAMPHADASSDRRRSQISRTSQVVEQQNWRRREYAIGIYHPSFREGWTL